MWPAINFFMWKWPAALKRLGRPVLGVLVWAHSVVTLLANSRGWSSLCVVFSLSRNFTVIAFSGWIYCIEIFFTFPWKTEFAVKFFTVLNICFTIQDFWATCDCPEKQRCPVIFHCIEYTFTFRRFEQLSLALKNSVCPENFHCFEHLFHRSGFLSNLRLPWKQSLPWIHCIEYIFFIVQDYWASCACPEKQSCLEIFHCIEIFFIVQDFSPTRACPENRFCAEFFQDGGRPPPPDLPPRTPMRKMWVSTYWRELLWIETITKHTLGWEIDERNLKIIESNFFLS